MPQTREHMEICTLLGVQYGFVALTKTDMVDEEWLELVSDDIVIAVDISTPLATREHLQTALGIVGQLLHEHLARRPLRPIERRHEDADERGGVEHEPHLVLGEGLGAAVGHVVAVDDRVARVDDAVIHALVHRDRRVDDQRW